mmetsp:Transcript_43859/g.72630  ORF Transcript_43859/g.72630 Transcript_43859/m.72630 type:complete len:294 (-) Transcript_43859:1291-2172(-)
MLHGGGDRVQRLEVRGGGGLAHEPLPLRLVGVVGRAEAGAVGLDEGLQVAAQLLAHSRELVHALAGAGAEGAQQGRAQVLERDHARLRGADAQVGRDGEGQDRHRHVLQRQGREAVEQHRVEQPQRGHQHDAERDLLAEHHVHRRDLHPRPREGLLPVPLRQELGQQAHRRVEQEGGQRAEREGRGHLEQRPQDGPGGHVQRGHLVVPQAQALQQVDVVQQPAPQALRLRHHPVHLPLLLFRRPRRRLVLPAAEHAHQPPTAPARARREGERGLPARRRSLLLRRGLPLLVLD